MCSEATTRMKKERTLGYFDLIRKTGSGTQHLRWGGNGYEETDRDPFPKGDFDILSDPP